MGYSPYDSPAAWSALYIINLSLYFLKITKMKPSDVLL